MKEGRKEARVECFGAQAGALCSLPWRWVVGTERDSEAGRVLLGPRCVPVGWEAPGGLRGRACRLGAKPQPPHLGEMEALWLWASAQLLGAL